MTRFFLSRRTHLLQAALLALTGTAAFGQTPPAGQPGSKPAIKMTTPPAGKPAAGIGDASAPVAADWPTKPVRLLIGFPLHL